MTVESEGAERSRVIKSWASIYDFVNSFIYLLFKGTKRLHQDIISMVGTRQPARVLDIGCGTGEFLIEVAKRYDNVEAFGVDASEEMIAIAKRKACSGGYSKLTFELEDDVVVGISFYAASNVAEQ